MSLCVAGLIWLVFFFFFLMIRRPPRSTLSSSSAASDVYKRQRRGRELAGGHRGIRRLRRGIRARGGVLAECPGRRAERRGCWRLLDGLVRGAVGRRRDVVAGVLGRAGHVPSFAVCSASQPSPDGTRTPVQMVTARPGTDPPHDQGRSESIPCAAAMIRRTGHRGPTPEGPLMDPLDRSRTIAPALAERAGGR